AALTFGEHWPEEKTKQGFPPDRPLAAGPPAACVFPMRQVQTEALLLRLSRTPANARVPYSPDVHVARARGNRPYPKRDRGGSPGSEPGKQTGPLRDSPLVVVRGY